MDNIGHDRHLYAFVRKIPAHEPRRYDGFNDLYTIIALSRLIRPTSTGGRYCAKVFSQPEADPPIQAIPFAGSPDVFLGDTSRDWLSPDDGFELRKLMPWVSAGKPMHARVQHAYWNHEQAMQTYYLDLRWNLVVSGLEALITVDDRFVRAQFVRRVGKLGNEFGIVLSEDELQDAYTLRSGLAHAQGFLYSLHDVLPPNEHKPLYDRLESLLRAIVKKALLDEPWGQNFADKTAVRNRWP